MSTATAAPPAAERRRAPRRQPALGTVYSMTDKGDTQVGLVWNISTSGVSLLFPEALAKGVTLRGTLQTSGSTKFAIAMRVAHVSKLMTGDFVLGCQFERPLTAEEMAAFVG